MYIGIDIGGTKTIINLYENLDANSLVLSKLIPTGKDYTALVQEIFDVIDKNTNTIEGIGISHIGLLDLEKGICLSSTNLPEFNNKPLIADFRKHFPKVKNIKLENDLVCAGLAEAIFGWGKNYDKTLYFTVSTGIGAALIYKLNGKPYVQQIEAGHFVIKGEGLDSPSGQLDIIEAYVGGRSMEKRFLKKPEDITDLLLWEKQVHYLSIAVINSIVMTSPEILVLGGGMIENNDYLREKLKMEVKEGLAITSFPNIKISSFGKNVVAHGALALLKSI